MNPIVYCAFASCSESDWDILSTLFFIILIVIIVLCIVEYVIKKK